MRQMMLLSLLCLPATALAYGNARDAEVVFDAVGPAGFKLQGKTDQLKLEESEDVVKITVTLGKLDTGIELRNRHMRDKYLEVAKFPEVQLAVKKADLKEDASGDIKGTLKLHGVEKPVTVKYSTKSGPKTVKMQGNFKINFNEYGIALPNYLGITVKPDIELKASFTVDK
jgi:polyisoprenoid-binding protein YceI